MHHDVVVASGYFAGDREAPPEELRRLTDYCSGKHLLLFIGCDANAHSIVWGSSDTNDRREQLLEFILDANLIIFNVGNSPTLITRA